MIKQYQTDFTQKNLQFLLVDHKGLVLECEPSFLPIAKGDSIVEFHPFFECLEALNALPDPEFSFHCVHLTIQDHSYITDIQVLRNKKGLLILVQNQTDHYNNYQGVAQARNESIINEELIVLKNNELEERERFKNLFIQNFSHELRNPLMSSMAIAQVLGNTALTPEQKQLLEVLRDSNGHLNSLLEDTLSLSMISSGKLEIRNAVFDFEKLLGLLAFTYTTRSKAKGLTFIFTVDKRVPLMVEGDRLRLFQILTNLLDNAIKYTTTGSVSLRVDLNNQYANTANIHFVVSDTGPGIPIDKHGTIYESFSQLDTPYKDQGTGLGLALVKGLLNLMGSEIQLESSLDKGSVFSFDLGLKVPLTTSAHPAQSSKPKVDILKMGVAGKKYKLLLVEDDERVLTVLFKILMDTKRFYIDVLNDGGLVLESVIQNNYDLILMDINLPNTSGDQLTKIIRDFPFKNIKQLPIVGMTANAYETHMKAYKEAGMNAVLAKPFEQDELLTTLFSVLR